MSSHPSLERLKALDTLPDLTSQLEEAKLLCNHSARADMICKWLLEKLKSTKEVYTNPETWINLDSALRLLSPERVATLLASHDFLRTCEVALQEAEDEAVQPQMNNVFQTLMGKSNGPHGTSIKAVLSVPSSQAASFLGIWLQTIHRHSEGSLVPWCFPDSLLWPGLEIWNWRKRSAGENEHFARHCLAPAAAMLTILSPEGPQPQTKRKRQYGGMQSPHRSRQTVVSLLAKHIFQPARTAFFKAQDLDESKRQRESGAHMPGSDVSSILEPLKEAFAKSPRKAHLALLLDIALRCAPTVTPRQRVKERPWIEALFEALNGCNLLPSGKITDSVAPREMLSVLGQQGASLSKETLEKLVKEYTNFGKASKAPEDWELIAQVVELDNDVFADRQDAELLFSDLTAAAIEESKLAPNRPDGHSKTLWKDRIIVPLIRAFAKRRDLLSFVELWDKQLRQDQHNKIWSVWAEVGDSFEPFMEDALTENQIEELFDRYFHSIKSAANISQPQLDACIVIVNAVLGSVRSEPLANRLRRRVSDLLTTMFQHCNIPAGGTNSNQLIATIEGRTWALMTKAFELWFPAWATHESDIEVLTDEGISLLKSHAVEAALSTASTIRSLNGSPTHLGCVAYDAEAFVASLCAHLYRYKPMSTDECWVACAETADKLVGQFDAANLQALIHYPELVGVLHENVLNDLIVSCVSQSANDAESANASASAHQALRAIAAAAVSNAQLEAVNTLVEVCIRHIRCDDKDEEEDVDNEDVFMKQEAVAINVLSTIPVRTFSRSQRENIINAVSYTQTNVETLRGPKLQAARFALLVKLMEVANATSVLATDPNEIWNLARSISSDEGNNYDEHDDDDDKDDDENDYEYDNTSRVLNFIEQLAKLLLGHLLATQDQERSRSMLTSLSAEVKKHMDFMCERRRLDGCGKALILVKSIISELESKSKEALKSQLAHCDPQTIKTFTEMSFEAITTRLSKVADDSTDISETNWLLPALDVLLAIPEPYVQSAHIDMRVLLDSMLPCLVKSRSEYEALGVHSRTFQAVSIHCYKLGCKFAESENAARFIALGTQIAELQLQPVEHELFLTSFACCFDKLVSEEKIGFLMIQLKQLKELKGETAKSLSLISLAELCIAGLDADDVAAATCFSLYRVLPKFMAIATKSNKLVIRKKALGCVAAVLKSKPFLTNQHSVDMTLVTLQKLLQEASAASILYLDLCQIMSTLLLQYRSRLQGRFHLVISVCQELVCCLFRRRSQTLDGSKSKGPSVKHARAVARLLTLFCEPTRLRRQTKTSELVDESRKEQAHVGQYVQFVLHHYCAQVLNGTIAEGMREALTPGLWSVIEAIEMNEAEGIKSLSAAMNNSERAVLRSVYDDWRRFGKWRDG